MQSSVKPITSGQISPIQHCFLCYYAHAGRRRRFVQVLVLLLRLNGKPCPAVGVVPAGPVLPGLHHHAETAAYSWFGL